MDTWTSPPRPDHPILACADRVHAAVDERVGGGPGADDDRAQKAEALLELSRGADRLHGLLLRVLAEADDVAQDAGARSPAAWLAHRTRSSHGTAVGAGRVADALEHRWHRVRAGLLAGTVNLEQARVLTRALDDLPADLDPDVGAGPRPTSSSRPPTFDPRRLRILGRKVLEVVAPDVAEDHERRALEDEERRARRTTRLTFRRRGDGTTEIHARVADAVAGRLRTYLEAFANPRRDRPAARGPDPSPTRRQRRVPHEVRLGRAFCALLEALPAKVLPRQGGSATTLVVTIPLDQLRRAGGRRRRRGGRRGTGATLRHRGAAAGLHGPDRARGPRRPGPAAAPRAGPAALQRRPAPGDGRAGRRLPGRRV